MHGINVLPALICFAGLFHGGCRPAGREPAMQRLDPPSHRAVLGVPACMPTDLTMTNDDEESNLQIAVLLLLVSGLSV
jgi:hypothetical protein